MYRYSVSGETPRYREASRMFMTSRDSRVSTAIEPPPLDSPPSAGTVQDTLKRVIALGGRGCQGMDSADVLETLVFLGITWATSRLIHYPLRVSGTLTTTGRHLGPSPLLLTFCEPSPTPIASTSRQCAPLPPCSCAPRRATCGRNLRPAVFWWHPHPFSIRNPGGARHGFR